MTSAASKPCAHSTLDDSIQLARGNRAPIRAVALIELARPDLQRSIEAIEEGNTVVELGLKAKK